jgi:hypothetical protein
MAATQAERWATVVAAEALAGEEEEEEAEYDYRDDSRAEGEYVCPAPARIAVEAPGHREHRQHQGGAAEEVSPSRARSAARRARRPLPGRDSRRRSCAGSQRGKGSAEHDEPSQTSWPTSATTPKRRMTTGCPPSCIGHLYRSPHPDASRQSPTQSGLAISWVADQIASIAPTLTKLAIRTVRRSDTTGVGGVMTELWHAHAGWLMSPRDGLTGSATRPTHTKTRVHAGSAAVSSHSHSSVSRHLRLPATWSAVGADSSCIDTWSVNSVCLLGSRRLDTEDRSPLLACVAHLLTLLRPQVLSK